MTTKLVLKLEDDLWMPGVGRIACLGCPEPGGLDTTRHPAEVAAAPPAPAGCPCQVGDVTAHYSDANASLGLLSALVSGWSAETFPNGWNAVVLPAILNSPYYEPLLWRIDDATLNLTIPQQLTYDIDTPETVALISPREFVLSDQPNRPDAVIIMPTAGKASINGSLMYGVDEVVMRSMERPPLNLVVTLQNDSWVESLGQGYNAATRGFAAGITAAEGNLNTCMETDPEDGRCLRGGWMHTVQPALMGPNGYLRIARLNDVEVRITLEGVPEYDLSAPDQLNVYVPREAVLSDQMIVAPQQIRIDATPGEAFVAGGSLIGHWSKPGVHITEAMLQASQPVVLDLVLWRDEWVAGLGTPNVLPTNRALLAGLVSAQAEASGWNAVVLPALRAACNFLQCPLLERVTAQIARVTIPALAGYDVAMPETIALTVPREAVLSDRVIPGRNSFRVRATPGKATLAGSLVDATRMAAAGEPITPIREAEVAAGHSLQLRNLTYVEGTNGTEGYMLQLLEGSPLRVEVALSNDTWVLQTDVGSGARFMEDRLKLNLALALASDLAECAGWDAVAYEHRMALVAGVQVMSDTRLAITLPAMPAYDIRVPETVTLVVPGTTVASDEDIIFSASGEPNTFMLMPDGPAADSLEVPIVAAAAGAVNDSLPYFAERWYMLLTTPRMILLLTRCSQPHKLNSHKVHAAGARRRGRGAQRRRGLERDPEAVRRAAHAGVHRRNPPRRRLHRLPEPRARLRRRLRRAAAAARERGRRGGGRGGGRRGCATATARGHGVPVHPARHRAGAAAVALVARRESVRRAACGVRNGAPACLPPPHPSPPPTRSTTSSSS